MSSEPIWHVDTKNLSVKIGATTLLDDLTLRIVGGKTTAIIGPNGSGKTTLLRAILGLVKYEGSVSFAPTDGASDQKPIISYVPQRFEFDRGMPITVEDFMLMDQQRLPLWIAKDGKTFAAAMQAMQRVGADKLHYKRLGVLSGGELQRVLLAKALMKKPNILLLDEPVSGVDLGGEELFCDLLQDLQRAEHFTLVMVSHDLSVVTRHADQVICINKNLICQGAVTEVITPENIQQIYGVHMGFHQHGHHGHKHSHGKGEGSHD